MRNLDVIGEPVRTCGAYPTHDHADDVLTKIKDEPDDYGRRVRSLYDPIWEREKEEYGYGPVCGTAVRAHRA